MPDYAKLAAEFGGTPADEAPAVDYGALAQEFGGTPQQPAAPAAPDPAKAMPPDLFRQMMQVASRPEAPPSRGVLGHAVEGAKTFGQTVNPYPAMQAVGESVVYGTPESVGQDVAGLATGYIQQNNQLFNRSVEAFKQGDLVTGMRTFTNYILNGIPGVGATLQQAGDDMVEGEYGRGVGRASGLAGAAFGPTALARAGAVRTPALMRNPNPVERAAVEFGQREGVPIDVATATGNRAAQGAQYLADRSLAGSVVGSRARAAQADAMTRTGERLASRVFPEPVVPEQAGAAVQGAVRGRVADFNAQATAAYDKLRAIEQRQAQRIAETGGVKAPEGAARPFTDVPLAVNVAPSKEALRPLYETLQQENSLVPFHSGSGKARALVALDRLMKAPDQAPLSITDAALGELKALARADVPELRTQGQGIAAVAVQNLDAAVMQAATQAGPDVVAALQAGRKATIAKHGAGSVFERLSKEPVQVFNRSTWQKDSGVQQLRDVANLAPGEMPMVGRAYLDDLLSKATGEGGFGHAQALHSQWSKLGPETKRVLFQDPALVQDLDNFFLLAKKMADNPNPSGTAYVGALGAQGTYLVLDPVTGAALQIGAAGLSKLLHSPRAVKLLTEGLRIPVSNRSAAAAAATELAAVAKEAGVPLAPAAAVASREERPLGR